MDNSLLVILGVVAIALIVFAIFSFLVKGKREKDPGGGAGPRRQKSS